MKQQSMQQAIAVEVVSGCDKVECVLDKGQKLVAVYGHSHGTLSIVIFPMRHRRVVTIQLQYMPTSAHTHTHKTCNPQHNRTLRRLKVWCLDGKSLRGFFFISACNAAQKPGLILIDPTSCLITLCVFVCYGATGIFMSSPSTWEVHLPSLLACNAVQVALSQRVSWRQKREAEPSHTILAHSSVSFFLRSTWLT